MRAVVSAVDCHSIVGTFHRLNFCSGSLCYPGPRQTKGRGFNHFPGPAARTVSWSAQGSPNRDVQNIWRLDSTPSSLVLRQGIAPLSRSSRFFQDHHIGLGLVENVRVTSKPPGVACSTKGTLLSVRFSTFIIGAFFTMPGRLFHGG